MSKILKTISKLAKREPKQTRFSVRTQRAKEFFTFMLDRWGLTWSLTVANVPEGRFYIFHVLDISIQKRDTLDFVIEFFDREQPAK